MQIIITDAWMAKSRAIHLTGAKLLLALMLASFALMLVAALLYHWVFLKGARDGWPVVGSLVRLVVKDEFDQRDRFMRENLDVLARKLGELQAKLTQLESLGERISGLAGMNPAESRLKAGQGGALVPGKPLSAQDIESAMAALLQQTGQRTDWMTVMESRLLDQKVRGMLHPTQEPVTGVIWARASAGVLTHLPALLRCTLAWITQPKSAPLSMPRPVAWWWRRNSMHLTAT